MPRIAGHYVVAYANSAGFTGNDLTIAAAVAKAESGWDTDSRYVTSQEDSRGLWQINTYAHPQYDKQRLYDPTYNAWAARQVWRNAGSRWTPWTTFTRGTYLQFWNDALNAVAEFQSLGGDPGSAPPTSSPGPTAPPVSGLYPNFGPFDPAPYLREFGFRLRDFAYAFDSTADAIRRLIQ